MYDPISVETALVSSGGDLLIQLSDGNVVNAGRVRGNPGPQGEQGEQGVRGAHGKDGIDGTNGAQWHTGVGAPEISVGENNDMYMDVASALLPIFQKVNGDWLFLTNLKVPPSGGGGGQSGAAGGGGSVILYPKPDGGAPPSTDNDGKPVDKGDIWLDLNTGWLWVYDGNNWIPVADRPPVIISPTPPNYNNASNENPSKPPQYAVKDGDLWLDPSTNQLYIYRDEAWSEITACTTSGNETGPIDFPVGTDFPADGNQIPDGHQHDNFYWDATLGAWKRVCGVSNQHCVRHYRSSCTGGSTAWTGTAAYSSVYEIQTEGDEQDLNVKDVFEVKYTGQTDYINVLDLDAAEQARIGFDRVEDGIYYFTNTAEAGIKDSIAVRHVVTLEDKDGNIYECPTDIYRLVYTSGMPPHNGNGIFGHADVLCCFDFDAADKRYVLVDGDTMTGDLIMDDADILMDNGNIEFEAKGDTAYIQNVDNRFGKIVSRAPKDTELGSTDFSSAFGVKVELNEGNSYRNNFVVGNQHGDIVKITSGTGAQIEFATTGFTPNLINTGLTSGIAIRHIPTPSFENSPGDLAVNKQYVDDRDELLRQDIIELEEEIDAIAPSLEYGTWKYEEPTGANITRPPLPGTFYLVSALGAVTDKYEEAVIIKIHNDEYVAPGDTDPVDNHTWADADVGELIQLFDAADPDFFLGKITAKSVDPVGELVSFTVDRIQSSGVPNDNPDPITNEYLTRINIFKEPSGGDASGFVLKTGDTMSGNLIIDTSTESTNTEAGLKLKGNRDNTTNSAATITFENEQSSSAIGYLTYRSYGGTSFFKFNQNVDLGINGLSGVDHIELKNGGYIGSGDKPRIRVRNGGGSNNQAGTDIQRPGDGMRTFAIKGKPAGSSNVEDFFWSYGNTGNGGDAINYTGLTTAANHIATKKYVDSKAGVDISCTTSGRSKGDMWYCTNDGTLYIKVS